MQAIRIWGSYGLKDEAEVFAAYGKYVKVSGEWKLEKYPLHAREESCAVTVRGRRVGTAYRWE